MELKESYLSCLQQSSLPIQNPLTVNKGMALVDVVSLLNTNINKHSCVLVEEKGQLLGLITERDLVKLAANGQDLREITVDTVMTKNLITMKASEAKDIFTVIKKLRCHHSRNLPILDNNNKIVGVVTVNSILTFLKPADILKYRQIAEVMSKNVIYTDGHTSLTDIAKLMATHKISCVVIGEKNNNQQVIARGIITERDIVRLHAQGLPFDELQAQTVMSTPLKMVQPEESLWSIQVHMQQHRIRRLAVGNSQGELLGIVTETDLVRAVDLTTLQNIVEILQEEVEELKDEKIKLLNRLNQELQIEVNQSKTKLQAEQEKEHLLASVALRIRQSVSLQTILQNTVTEVRQLLDNERVVISRYNCDGTHQVVVESVNKCELSLLGETPAIVGINVDQIQIIKQEEQLLLIVPLWQEDRLWGLLIAENCSQAKDWLWEDREFWLQLSTQVAIAIEQASLIERLETELEQRKQAEAELQEVKEQLELKVKQRTAELEEALHTREEVLNSLFTFVGVINTEGIIIEANQQLLELTNLKKQAIGQPFLKIFSCCSTTEEVQNKLGDAIALAMAGEKVRCDFNCKNKTIDLFINPIFNEQKKINYLVLSGIDISERKKVFNALQESEESFRLLVDGVKDYGICLLDTSGYIVSWNVGAQRITGYSNEEIVGQHFSYFFPPTEIRQGKPIQELAMAASQGRYEGEGKRIYQDGRERWVNFILTALYDENGELRGFSKVIRDITATRETNLKLRLLERAIAASNNGIIITDASLPNNAVIYANSGFEKITGYSQTEIIGSNCRFLQGKERQQPGLQELRRAISEKTACTVTLRNYRRDGTMFWNELSISPILDDFGQLTHYVGVQADITERKQAEEERDRFFTLSLDMLCIANVEGYFLRLNPSWEKTLGYSQTELKSKPFLEYVHPEDRHKTLTEVEKLSQGYVTIGFENRYQCKDGSYRWLMWNSSAVHETGAIYAVAHDVTEYKQAEEALFTSQLLLSGVLNSSLDGIMAFKSVRDNQNQIIDFQWLVCNASAGAIVDRSSEELIGKNLLEEMPGNRSEGLFDLYMQVVETGESCQQEFYYEHEKVKAWFETIVVKLEDGFAVTFRNITQTKLAEQQLKKVNQELEQRVDELKQRNEEMILLSEMSDFLQACLTAEEAYLTLTSLLKPLFPDCQGAIYMLKTSKNLLEMVSSWGGDIPSESIFDPKNCWGLRRSKLHLVDQQHYGLLCNHIDHHSPPAVSLCVPMMAQGETLGLLYLSTNIPERLTRAKEQLARTVAEQLGLAIANLQLRETLQHQNIRDPLTGLFNRRYLEENLVQQLHLAERQEYSVGVVMIDVDHFKKFNDNFGHEAGDLVLKELGKLLKNSIRKSDMACRYGGEELTLIFPQSSLLDSYQKAEEIRQKIKQLQLQHQGRDLGVITASLGVASYPEDGKIPSVLIQTADAALYEAKAGGRDRVVCAHLNQKL